MNSIDPHKAVNFLIENSEKFAKAKSERVYIEEYKKAKKALLMGECQAKTAAEREQFAYAHPEYIALLGGLREAVEIEETLRWQMVAAQARIEVWRSTEASNRTQDRVTR